MPDLIRTLRRLRCDRSSRRNSAVHRGAGHTFRRYGHAAAAGAVLQFEAGRTLHGDGHWQRHLLAPLVRLRAVFRGRCHLRHGRQRARRGAIRAGHQPGAVCHDSLLLFALPGPSHLRAERPSPLRHPWRDQGQAAGAVRFQRQGLDSGQRDHLQLAEEWRCLGSNTVDVLWGIICSTMVNRDACAVEDDDECVLEDEGGYADTPLELACDADVCLVAEPSIIRGRGMPRLLRRRVRRSMAGMGHAIFALQKTSTGDGSGGGGDDLTTGARATPQPQPVRID